MWKTRSGIERAYLVGAGIYSETQLWTPQESLEELKELCRSAGARVVGTKIQRLKRPNHTYLGAGKLQEIASLAQQDLFDTLVCDDELSPTQQLNIEKALGQHVKVIDRTALILDVFARRARTREGRLQVELAQHEYLLPRLAGQWSHLERLGGGIGTRGPGETQIETDRRLVRNRILKVKKALDDVRRHRNIHRTRRRDQGLPIASLVGYTNAGKSTLLNKLTGADVLAQRKLFSTLDPTTRRMRFAVGMDLLITDTVGFIQKLPPAIVAAFRATLEEIEEASLVIHVVDITHPKAGAHVDVVQGILHDMNLTNKPQLFALNKIDLLGNRKASSLMENIIAKGPENQRTVFVSAITGDGLDRLIGEIECTMSS